MAYFEEPEKLIGSRIPPKFPSANQEIIEAGRCYALGRNTACVFHLMCALEVGLHATAKVFGVPTDYANWQRLLDGIEKEIAKIGEAKDKPPTWKDDREFYS